jgi:hypothetical protein
MKKMNGQRLAGEIENMTEQKPPRDVENAKRLALAADRHPRNERLQKLAFAIDRGECKKHLDKIENKVGDVVLGIPRRIVVFAVIMAAEGRWDVFSKEVKQAFRDRALEAKECATGLEECAASLDRMHKKFPTVPVLEDSAAKTDSLGSYSKTLFEYLKKHGRADHDQSISLIVDARLLAGNGRLCW